MVRLSICLILALSQAAAYAQVPQAQSGLNIASDYGTAIANPQASSVNAQTPWSGILVPSRATDWTQAGIPGGIPTYTKNCQVIKPSGDTTGATDTTNIDNAIQACGGKSEVVLLDSGTFYVTGINFGCPNAVSNVVLRGQGPPLTTVKFLHYTGCGWLGDVVISGNSGYITTYAGNTTWTAGYAQGSTDLTVGTTSGLSVGQIVVLDQRDDDVYICPASGGRGNCSNEVGITESTARPPVVTVKTSLPHHFAIGDCVAIGGLAVTGYNGWWYVASVPSPTSFTYTRGCNGNTTALASGLAASGPTALINGGGGAATIDNGGVLVSSNPSPAVVEEGGVNLGRICPDAVTGALECATGEISKRNQTEIKRITAIDAATNTITVYPPLQMTNWRAGQNPGIWWTGQYATGDGIENITLDYTNDGGGAENSGIVLNNTYQSWVKNVRSISGGFAHVMSIMSLQDEIENNYFFGTKRGANESYGVLSYAASAASLMQNNICQHVVGCMMAGGSYGDVFSYNYSVDIGTVQYWYLYCTLVMNHDFSAFNLFEGNDGTCSYTDNDHGTTSNGDTAFRNRLRGQDTPLKVNGLIAAQVTAFNRGVNWIGNVLGTGEKIYQITGVPLPPETIFNLGAASEAYPVPYDPIATASTLRWGNYDVVTDAVRWCGKSSDPGWSSICGSVSDIPTDAFAFINGNPVPDSTTLPESFYLSAQPAFWHTPWGTPPFPAIGPDVTGGTAPDGVAGYSYAIPAQLCYDNLGIDNRYQQVFDITRGTVGAGNDGFDATITLTIGTNSFAEGDVITIKGVSPATFDGIYEVQSATDTTVTYGMTTDPGTYRSGGRVTYPNIRSFEATKCYPDGN